MSGWSSDLFVSNMDAYLCAICREVCREAMTVNCGHTFCQSCIMTSSFACPGTCPMCRATVFQTVPDFSKRLLILGSHTHCTNRENGCKEVDALSRIMDHTKQCQFRLEPCILCKVSVIGCNMEKHQTDECTHRLVECDKCSQKVTFSYLQTHTVKKCPMLNVTCRHCEWKGLLRDLDGHKEVCVKLPRPCSYKKYGCHDMISLETKAEHDKNTDHLVKVCQELDARHQATQNYIDSIRPDGPYLIHSHPHKVFLCSGLTNYKCSACKNLVSNCNAISLGYTCREMMCHYTLCTQCFPEHRLYKSKQANSFRTGFSFFNMEDID